MYMIHLEHIRVSTVCSPNGVRRARYNRELVNGAHKPTPTWGFAMLVKELWQHSL